MVQLFRTTNTGDWPNTKVGATVWYLTFDRADNFYPIAKQKGFMFAGRKNEMTGKWEGRLNWFTSDEYKAAELCDYAINSEIGRELLAIKNKGIEAVKLSRAETTDKILPCPEGEEYLGYQAVGIQYACDRTNTLIADDPGLGKTIQVLGFINCNPNIKRVLIVVPNTLKLNWKREAIKWLINDYSIGIADTKNVPIGSDIIITNYDALKKESVNKLIASVKWDLWVIDEAHYYKNTKTIAWCSITGRKHSKKNAEGAVKTKEFKKIESDRKIFTTGTPIENFVHELWPLISILDPDRWNYKTFWKFHTRYCGAKSNGYGTDYKGANEEHLPELQDILRKTIMVRRLKDEVLKELPPRRRSIVELEYDKKGFDIIEDIKTRHPEITDKYDEALAQAELAKAAGNDEAYKKAIEKMDEPIDIPFDELSAYRVATGRKKVPYVVEYLKGKLEEVSKIIVGCWHKEVVFALEKAFPGQAMSIYADVSVDERQQNVDRFQIDPKCRLALLTKAGYEGITLTASSTVVVVEEPWKPSSLNQLESRAHRIGQRDVVDVIHLVFSDSIDAKMLKRILKKQQITDIALNDEYELKEEKVVVEKVGGLEDKPKYTKKPEEPVVETTDVQRVCILQALEMMCESDGDFAKAKNGVGFNKFDSTIGHSLASLQSLSEKQAALGMKILRKYKNQIPETIYEKIFKKVAS